MMTDPNPQVSFVGFAQGKITRGGVFQRFRNRDRRPSEPLQYVFAAPFRWATHWLLTQEERPGERRDR